jgi:hypothetical protein
MVSWQLPAPHVLPRTIRDPVTAGGRGGRGGRASYLRDAHRQRLNVYARSSKLPTFLCSSDTLRLSATVMFVMVVNPDDNSLEEIEVEPYDRFPTEEEARMFTEEGESFLYAHACFFLWNWEH